MKIIDTRVLKGPNYWSNFRRKLIVMKVDLGELKDSPSHTIPFFNERIKKLIPTLSEHTCYTKKEGGFLKKLKDGTYLGHVIEHVALELQWLAGMKCGYGRTRQAYEDGVYYIVFEYMLEEAGIYAGKKAFNIVRALAHDLSYEELTKDIDFLKQIHAQQQLGPSTQAIVQEAEMRNIPWRRLDENSLILFGQGCKQKIIRATETGNTSTLGVQTAKDKALTKTLLAESFIPVPEGFTLTSQNDLQKVLSKIKFPVVIKPRDANHGKGITSNIKNLESAYAAFELAQKIGPETIVEKYIEGFDYRFLAINYKVVAVAQREPAKIVGDGTNTIFELIQQANADPQRGYGHSQALSYIEIDEVTEDILRRENLTLTSILAKEQTLYLKYAANLSTGGTAIDVTEKVHPENIFLVERVARLIQLDICGIDVIAKDINQPLASNGGAIIEINSSPGLRMHLYPTAGKPINVAASILDMLFPLQDTSRIPITAVTGTNGKTTVVRLISHMAALNNFSVGFTTTEGIYLNQKQIFKGDCSGPASAFSILREPTVDFAVLECARGGILRAGLGFDLCDISVVTNISGDHLDMNGIHTLEDLARVKSVVARSTQKEGYTILNADDNLTYALMDEVECNIALFSMNANSVRIRKHVEQGGIAAFLENDAVVLTKAGIKKRIINIQDVPITYNGRATSMIKNILPAIIAGTLHGFPEERIIQALKTFMPNAKMLPGRMNLFNFKNYNVLMDYAHNEGAYIELEKYFTQVQCTKKVGIVSATGDRRDSDIQTLGKYFGTLFDEIIIRYDKNPRGRSLESMTGLLMRGIQEVSPEKKVQIIPHEFEAIQYAMDHAIADSLIFYFPDKVLEAVDYMQSALTKLQG